ncbi:MAG: autotransporter-associated beta strand repeat-containing protein [Kiritimatiellae bacterium]|nr:autotransporter-associated beta strand repeat-containing protein [Kiritimatiellia bacterium]
MDKIYMEASAPNGDSVINFNGGLLVAKNAELLFLEGLKEANVLAGGVLIDTAGNGITINQDLLDGGGGGLTKYGDGRLILGGANTFTGGVEVKEGILRAADISALGTTDGSTTVNDGASLELSGNVTITNESLVIYGKTSYNFGALSSVSGDNTWNGDVLVGKNDTRFSAVAGTILRLWTTGSALHRCYRWRRPRRHCRPILR